MPAAFELVFRRAVWTDLTDAHDWYSRQVPGLGSAFFAEVERTLEAIRAYPEAHAKVLNEVRRATLRRFPHCVFYKVRGRFIVIEGVLHPSRDPRVLRSRR